MAYSALDVAKFIIKHHDDKEVDVSNLRLQKLLYFSWVKFYNGTRRALFADEICAWQFGPVVPDVYYKYCSHAGRPIRLVDYCQVLTDEDAAILSGILDDYLGMSTSTLVNISHDDGTAWDAVYNRGRGCRGVIPFGLIVDLDCYTGE